MTGFAGGQRLLAFAVSFVNCPRTGRIFRSFVSDKCDWQMFNNIGKNTEPCITSASVIGILVSNYDYDIAVCQVWFHLDEVKRRLQLPYVVILQTPQIAVVKTFFVQVETYVRDDYKIKQKFIDNSHFSTAGKRERSKLVCHK